MASPLREEASPTCREAEVEDCLQDLAASSLGSGEGTSILLSQGGVGEGCLPISLGLFRLPNGTPDDPSPIGHSVSLFSNKL